MYFPPRNPTHLCMHRDATTRSVVRESRTQPHDLVSPHAGVSMPRDTIIHRPWTATVIAGWLAVSLSVQGRARGWQGKGRARVGGEQGQSQGRARAGPVPRRFVGWVGVYIPDRHLVSTNATLTVKKLSGESVRCGWARRCVTRAALLSEALGRIETTPSNKICRISCCTCARDPLSSGHHSRSLDSGSYKTY